MDETVAAQQLTSALSALDFAVVAAALIVLFVIAYFAGRKEEDTRDFFLGGRNVPGIIACLSFVATEVSAVTIIAVPAAGFRENWEYLQFFIGSAAARITIAFLFIPVFFRFNCTTIYEFLRHRFGPETQYAGAVFFFITRLLASGVRLYAACLGISVILGWTLEQSLLLFTAASIAFIAFGGIKAVVWTGAYAAAVFYIAGVAVAVYLFNHIHGGFAEIWRTAGDGERLHLFNLKLTLADPNTLWAAALNAFFVGLAVFGTDQELMQRLLTVRTRRSSQKALLATIAAGLPLVALYLGIGTLLFVFYRQNPALPLPEKTDTILSHFVVNTLPYGLKGLMLAAVILASIDSPLNSLSSCFVNDIYRRLIVRDAPERHYLWVSRACVVGFGIVLALLALLCKPLDRILWVAFQVLAVTGGSTLGIFLLGLLTKRRGNLSNVWAMTISAVVCAVLLALSCMKLIPIGWSWLIVIGTGLTFAIGYAFGTVRGMFDGPKDSS